MNGRRAGRVRVGAVVGSALVAAVVVAGCSSSDGGSPSAAVAGVSSPGAEMSTDKGGVAAGQAGAPTSGDAAKQPVTTVRADDVLTGRSVIRTATLTVRVPKVLEASSAVTAAAAAQGGYVAGEQTAADPEHPDRSQAVLTVRVPAPRLPALLSTLHGMGDLLAEQQDAADVTAQVVDVQARLATQQASVNRVRALLAQATTLGQVVQIEGELARREADLESLQAQSKKLADQTALATVTVTLAGPAVVPPAPEPEPAGFVAGLSKGWHAFVEASTWLLTAVGALLPFALLLALLGLPVWLAVRRRRGAGPAGSDDATPPSDPPSSLPPAPAAA